MPRRAEERPAGPQHDRRRQHDWTQAESGDTNVVQAEPRHMAAHFQHEDRQREHQRRSRSGGSCRSVRDSGLLRRSRPTAPAPCRRSGSFPAFLPDFGMHRAGVDRVHGRRRSLRRLRVAGIALRVRGELLAAPGAAKVDDVTVPIEAVLDVRRPRSRKPGRLRLRASSPSDEFPVEVQRRHQLGNRSVRIALLDRVDETMREVIFEHDASDAVETRSRRRNCSRTSTQ